MDNKIIDGKLIADQMKKEIAAEVAEMIDKVSLLLISQRYSLAMTAQARHTCHQKRRHATVSA